MKTCFAWILLFTTTTATATAAEVIDVWFGTLTTPRGPSQGIYHASLEVPSGKWGEVSLAAELQHPSFLALHPDGHTLYSTGQFDGKGTVNAFRIEGGNGNATLQQLGSVETGDGRATHLSTSRDGRVLLSAQFSGGSTTLYALAEDGSIQRRVSVHEHVDLLTPAGSGVVPRRQDSPHAHWAGTSPDDRFAFVPDLGMDKVVIYKLNTETPSLTHHGFGICPPGSGPRHMKFTPDGERIYVLNELTLAVTAFDYDAESGQMKPFQTVPTLSDQTKAEEIFNSAAEIRIDPSGRFVYTSNRGDDSITAFSLDQRGRMSVVEVEPVRGSWPRNFALDPSGRLLVAAGRDSHTAAVFSVDEQTGELTYLRQTAQVPAPICVLFGPVQTSAEDTTGR